VVFLVYVLRLGRLIAVTSYIELFNFCIFFSPKLLVVSAADSV